MDYQQMFVALAKLAVFSVFITAIIEVFKGIAIKGLWTFLKEFLLSLINNHPLSSDSVHTLTFVVALFYCKVFDYGVMSNIMQLNFGANALAYMLDYIGTASLVYMGAGWAYNQFALIKNKFENKQEQK